MTTEQTAGETSGDESLTEIVCDAVSIFVTRHAGRVAEVVFVTSDGEVVSKKPDPDAPTDFLPTAPNQS